MLVDIPKSHCIIHIIATADNDYIKSYREIAYLQLQNPFSFMVHTYIVNSDSPLTTFWTSSSKYGCEATVEASSKPYIPVALCPTSQRAATCFSSGSLTPVVRHMLSETRVSSLMYFVAISFLLFKALTNTSGSQDETYDLNDGNPH